MRKKPRRSSLEQLGCSREPASPRLTSSAGHGTQASPQLRVGVERGCTGTSEERPCSARRTPELHEQLEGLSDSGGNSPGEAVIATILRTLRITFGGFAFDA